VAVDRAHLRKDSQAVERQVLYWNPQGRRERGRSKRTWRRTVEEETGRVGKTDSDKDASWKLYAPEGTKRNKCLCVK
jgi:hypothetical protein